MLKLRSFLFNTLFYLNLIVRMIVLTPIYFILPRKIAFDNYDPPAVGIRIGFEVPVLKAERISAIGNKMGEIGFHTQAPPQSAGAQPLLRKTGRPVGN